MPLRPFATERLHADDGAYHVALDVDIADMRGSSQRLRARISAGLDTEREAVAQGVDLCDDGFGRGERAAAPAHDLQHRAEDFVIYFAKLATSKAAGCTISGQIGAIN